MTLLSPQDARTLRDRFRTEMQRPVQIWLYTQTLNCPTCPQAEQIARELEQLTDRIELHIKNPLIDPETPADRPQWVPAFVIRTEQEDYGLRYYGLPAGFEFSVLVETILMVSRGTTFLEPPVVEKVRQLVIPLNIKVFVTPTCPYCPQMAFLAMELAFLRDNITAEVIEAEEFPELAMRYSVRGVPRTVVNDSLIVDGAVPPEMFIDQLLRHQEVEQPAQPQQPEGGRIILP